MALRIHSELHPKIHKIEKPSFSVDYILWYPLLSAMNSEQMDAKIKFINSRYLSYKILFVLLKLYKD